MTTLNLVRHGQTEDNVAQIMQGQTHGHLTAEGTRQAFLLRDKLASQHVDVFLSSDLQRAIDTCTILAAPHNLPVISTPLLRERDWGDFTGLFIPHLKDRPWPDNVESLGSMRERARQFLRLLHKQYDGKVVVAVGHGIINKAIQAVYFGKQMNEISRMENCEVRTLLIT